MSCDFFGPGSVVWDLQSPTKFDAIHETIHRTRVFAEIPGLDIDRFTAAVIAREKEQSTGFGRGIAISHGRDPVVADSRVALGVSRHGIEFDSYDGQPVHLLFVVANHPDKHVDYLRILSSLTTVVRNEIFRHEIMSAICCEEVETKMGSALRGALAGAV